MMTSRSDLAWVEVMIVIVVDRGRCPSSRAGANWISSIGSSLQKSLVSISFVPDENPWVTKEIHG